MQLFLLKTKQYDHYINNVVPPNQLLLIAVLDDAQAASRQVHNNPIAFNGCPKNPLLAYVNACCAAWGAGGKRVAGQVGGGMCHHRSIQDDRQ